MILLDNTKQIQEFVEQFLRVNNQLTQIQKIPIKIQSDIQLSTSAIHLIDVVGNHPPLNISELAEVLGVTKGAVSQQVSLLIKSDLIQSFQKPDNKKDKLLRLTEKGNAVYNSHNELHAELYLEIGNTLAALDTNQQRAVTHLLDRVSGAIGDYQMKLNERGGENVRN